MKRQLLFVNIIVIILFWAMLAGVIPPAGDVSQAFAQTRKAGPGVDDIFNTVQLMREEYIKVIDPFLLLQGSVNGIRNYLKSKKLDDRAIKEFSINRKRTMEANMRSFNGVYGKILMYNGGKVNETEMVYAALDGMMKTVQKTFNDPHTVALDPKEYEALEEQLNSRGFSGIGIFIELDKKQGNLPMVVEPVEGSPAQKAGLKAGDIILGINGKSTRGLSLDAVSNRVRGPLHTQVVLTVKRKNTGQFKVTITREMVQMKSVAFKMINQLGYIKLRFFGETTADEMKDAMAKLEGKGARGIILDLRNNGGGYVIAADEVCSIFVREGLTVTSVVNYRNGSVDVHRASGSPFKSLPLAVIVNNFSASASEITAGCIKDHQAGILIGTKTFGKGSVQTIHQITGGGAIKYTTAHYLTPKGKDINKMGISPDIEVKMDPSFIGSSKDAQLKKAVSYLSQKISKN